MADEQKIKDSMMGIAGVLMEGHIAQSHVYSTVQIYSIVFKNGAKCFGDDYDFWVKIDSAYNNGNGELNINDIIISKNFGENIIIKYKVAVDVLVIYDNYDMCEIEKFVIGACKDLVDIPSKPKNNDTFDIDDTENAFVVFFAYVTTESLHFTLPNVREKLKNEQKVEETG